MTHFDPTYAPEEMNATSRTSVLAVLSFICGLICCVPVTSIPAVIMGVLALGLSAGKPHVRGKGLAIAGIVLGLIGVLLQAGVWFGIVTPLNRLSLAVLQPGLSGDVIGVRANFTTAADASMTDDEITAFFSGIVAQIGAPTSSSFSISAYGQAPNLQPPPGTTVVPLPYTLVGPNGSMSVIIWIDTNQSSSVSGMPLIDHVQAGSFTAPTMELPAPGSAPTPVAAPTVDPARTAPPAEVAPPPSGGSSSDGDG
ncbi:MAG: DUF4190 domain-containing protein [Phycisphaerales bacterium]|nr:DUF4190 domain-containing protein [Phycisphaerales bacterium]